MVKRIWVTVLVTTFATSGCLMDEVRMCAEGYAYDEAWRCVPHDAGRLDAEAGDAGRDGGTDAFMPDAFMPDAGQDAGPDAGPCGMACTGETPFCDEASMSCVECLERSDCATAELPACVGNACVECGANTDCQAATASKCDATNQCTACGNDGDCSHVTGTNVCLDGTCVQCRAGTDCASGVCLLSSNTCAPMGGTGVRCSECVRDAECQAGMLCVPMRFGGQPVGQHCLWRRDATGTGAPNGSCVTNARPFAISEATTSVDGTTATFCTLRNSTCEAQSGYPNTNCMTLDAAGDARCGRAGVADGVCREFETGVNRCTVFCLSDDDCPEPARCDISATPRVCNF